MMTDLDRLEDFADLAFAKCGEPALRVFATIRGIEKRASGTLATIVDARDHLALLFWRDSLRGLAGQAEEMEDRIRAVYPRYDFPETFEELRRTNPNARAEFLCRMTSAYREAILKLTEDPTVSSDSIEHLYELACGRWSAGQILRRFFVDEKPHRSMELRLARPLPDDTPDRVDRFRAATVELGKVTNLTTMCDVLGAIDCRDWEYIGEIRQCQRVVIWELMGAYRALPPRIAIRLAAPDPNETPESLREQRGVVTRYVDAFVRETHRLPTPCESERTLLPFAGGHLTSRLGLMRLAGPALRR